MLKHWVDAHFYDFELPDGHLMDKLESFLSDVESGGKSMGKWVDNIRKKIYLKVTFIGASKKQKVWETQFQK